MTDVMFCVRVARDLRIKLNCVVIEQSGMRSPQEGGGVMVVVVVVVGGGGGGGTAEEEELCRRYKLQQMYQIVWFAIDSLCTFCLAMPVRLFVRE